MVNIKVMEKVSERGNSPPDVGSHATSPIDPSVTNAMVDIEMARIVVLGEASLLTTALLKCHHSHHTYYYGSRGGLGSGLKQSMSLPNRLAFAVAVENEEDEDDFLDDTFGIISDPSNGTPSSPVHHPLPTDPILKNLIRLKGKLRKGSRSSFNVTTDPSYLIPFCEVIKNKDTSGPITGMALQSILKFINYDLVSYTESLGSVQLIGDSVTKARFIGTDTSSDEVVLMRILDVLKQLIIRGYKSLSNETICEIMQSSFRIAFEPRLSELLRKNAEQALLDMVRCLFQKLSSYTDEYVGSNVGPGLIKSGSGVKMPSGFGKKKEKMYQSSITERMEINSSANSSPTNESVPSISGDTVPVRDQLVKSMSDASLAESVASDTSIITAVVPESAGSDNESIKPDQDVSNQLKQESNINRNRTEPHGIESINELLCYMTTLTSPLPESQNSESMINIGLNLLIVAFESAITDIGNKSCLLKVIKNDLCFNMIQLLQSSRPLTSFALTLRLCFLIFTALRHLLKYQMEMLFTRLKELITTGNAPIEYRELSLEYLVGFFRHLPSLSHELFFNYDLDPYASNLLEDLYQFFSKNCFSSSSPNDPSVSGSGIAATGSASFSPIQLLSLDAFLTNLNSLHRAELCKDVSLIPGSEIDSCTVNESDRQSPPGDRDIGLPEPHPASEPNFESKVVLVSSYPKTLLEIEHLKQRKRMLWMASDQFNIKPAKGIQFLKENGLVADEKEIATFLRDNSKLDKKMLGEYLSHKNNPIILNAFIDTFNLRGTRLDEALRLYLETFRLPGEAPLVSNLLEPFAVSWHINNDSPFENNDAAYTLSYAIIMLNVDQHNINVKRQTPSMTCKQFINNLRQVNGGKDFDPKMLTQIYEAIKTKEIVMPAEHHGILRDKYLWKCLLGKSETSAGVYWFSDFKGSSVPIEQTRRYSTAGNPHAIPLHLLNNQLFSTLWGPAIAAMTFVFDKININHNSNLTQRILNNGFSSCALLCSSYGHLDNLIVILCKFTLSSNTSLNTTNTTSVNYLQPLLSHKSQMAAQTLFGILREYSNYMRESWSNIVEIILHWFKSGFLDDLLEVDDFALNEKLKMKRKITVKSSKNSNESSSTFLSSFYMYFAGSNPDIAVESMKMDDGTLKSSAGVTGDGASSSGPSSLNAAPENLINKYCQPLSLVEESRFLHIDSLLELIKALMNVQIEVVDEEGDDIEAFRLELLVQITLLNR